MDIVSDLKYINNYGIGWFAIYYMSVGIGILLITFPVEINTDDLVWTEQPNVKKTSETADLLDKYGCAESKFVSSDYGSLNKASGTSSQLTEDGGSVNFRARKKMFKLNEKLVEEILKILKVLFTLVFVDIMFASIRFKIMVAEKSIEHGFNMVVKNIILAGLHTSYLVQMLRIYVFTKKKRQSILGRIDFDN